MDKMAVIMGRKHSVTVNWRKTDPRWLQYWRRVIQLQLLEENWHKLYRHHTGYRNNWVLFNHAGYILQHAWRLKMEIRVNLDIGYMFSVENIDIEIMDYRKYWPWVLFNHARLHTPAWLFFFFFLFEDWKWKFIFSVENIFYFYILYFPILYFQWNLR